MVLRVLSLDLLIITVLPFPHVLTIILMIIHHALPADRTLILRPINSTRVHQALHLMSHNHNILLVPRRHIHHHPVLVIHHPHLDTKAPLGMRNVNITTHNGSLLPVSSITNIPLQIPMVSRMGMKETDIRATETEIGNAATMIGVRRNLGTLKTDGIILRRQVIKRTGMSIATGGMANIQIEMIGRLVDGDMNSDKSDRHNRRKQQSVRTPSRTAPSERHERSPLDRGTPIVVKTDQEREPGEIVSEPTSSSEHDNTDNILNAIPEKDEEDLSWDERTIFQEPLVTIKVDPIAAPLPAEYSEDVMIPPAFDAKALKSQYITPRNVDDFSQSVRETRDWQVMQYHPVFLKPEDICPEKLRDYYKAAKKDIARYIQRERPGNYLGVSKQRYGNSKGSGRQHGKNQETRHKPDQRKRRWNDFHGDADEDRTERRHRDFPYDDMLKKKLKPASPEPGEVIEDESQESPYEPPDAQIVTTDNTERLRESGVIKDAVSRDFSVNNGSNGSSQETTSQRDTQGKSTKTQLSTPLALTEDNLSSYDQLSSRNSSQSFHGKSPRSRRTSIGSQDSVSGGSDLDSIDRELLGLAEPEAGSSEVKEEPLKQQQLNKITPKRKRRQQMSAAYSRRW
ncbi:hypothetical protein ABKA04_006850 [Annulohypoxylon sp. FPYF3050]